MKKYDPYDELQKNIERRTWEEVRNKAKHNGTRIIFNREISPVQIYQNVMDNTVFTYRNRVLDEGRKVILRLKGIRKKRIIGSIIQWIGLILNIIFVIYMLGLEFLGWNNDLKLTRLIAVFGFLVGIPLIVIGGIIKLPGGRYRDIYCAAPNPVTGHAPLGQYFTEFNCLKNGQLVLMTYKRSDKKQTRYLSALYPDDTLWRGGRFSDRVYIPTYVHFMYVIDSIKSCTKTKKGLMIESSGRLYGVRGAKRGGTQNTYWYGVFAETQVSYRKDEIPAIFENMESLEASLMNYGYFEPGRNTFSPLG